MYHKNGNGDLIEKVLVRVIHFLSGRDCNKKR
jgi:hypothetical protein